MTPNLAIVTGTSSGIGLTVARKLLERSWTVVGIARREAPIEHAQYRHLALDLGDLQRMTSVFERAVAPLVGDKERRRVGLVNNAAGADPLIAVERIDPVALMPLYSTNVAAPLWLMGFVARHTPARAALRIVNVSSAAAVTAFPGLAAYGSSKAALRMAGMVFAAELAAPDRRLPAPADVGILSYEPGIVDTPMQTLARSQPAESFPSAQLFHNFHSQGILVPPDAPAAEILGFLETGATGFTERRLGA